MFARVLVANRGEIALRVLRTLHAAGHRGRSRSTATPTRTRRTCARPTGRCGSARRPLPSRTCAIERVVAAALETGAEAIHPGYGFLSERPEFARACTRRRPDLRRPSPEAMALLGDKAAAKQVAADAGVPVVPGLHGESLGDAEILDVGRLEELPLLVKAVAGGGGKGMRVVRSHDELPEALRAARSEARAAFGDDRLLVER